MKKSIIYFMMCLAFFALFVININLNTSFSVFHTVMSSLLICASGVCLGFAIGNLINK